MERLGRSLHQDHETQQERQLGDASALHEAHGGHTGHHLLQERDQTYTYLRLHKWAKVALNLQWSLEECFPLKALLLYRDQEWWERTQTDEGLGKRNCEVTRKYRHGTNVPMRRWEAPFVETFGVNWKRSAVADDGARWHESRWVFAGTTLKNYKIRLTSLQEKLKEPEEREERLASGEKPQKRHKSKNNREADDKAGGERAGAERDQMAGAAWSEVWTMPSVRSQRQKGGFAALVDSANVAGWLRGTRVMGDSYGDRNGKRLENTMETLECYRCTWAADPSAPNGSIG